MKHLVCFTLYVHCMSSQESSCELLGTWDAWSRAIREGPPAPNSLFELRNPNPRLSILIVHLSEPPSSTPKTWHLAIPQTSYSCAGAGLIWGKLLWPWRNGREQESCSFPASPFHYSLLASPRATPNNFLPLPSVYTLQMVLEYGTEK